MIWTEGGGSIETTTLFGKYQLCRVIGSGRFGTVFLAVHTELGEYRAIKRVPKLCVDYERFREEALVMKTLKHPGIPLVYDLEEDETYSYLIEEFLEGDSLYSLVSKEGRFSTAMTIRYGIQICHLVMYMHSAKPIPILYLDLQPKNLLVCHDVIKLVDFGQVSGKQEALTQQEKYGTAGFAAPEQYAGEKLDVRADIYAIGAVLFYMMTAKNPAGEPDITRCLPDGKITDVIRICMQSDRNMRFASVEELCEQLEKQEKELSKNVSSLYIVVAGADRGAGATHAAFGLASYLKSQGIAALYEERNDMDAVRRMARRMKVGADSCGIFRIKGISCMPKYGEAIHLKPHNYKVVISDYGTETEAALQEHADVVLLVSGANGWERGFHRETLMAAKDRQEVVFICNHVCGRPDEFMPASVEGKRCFLMPWFFDPFQVTKEAKEFYRRLLFDVLRERGEGWLRKEGVFGGLGCLWRRIRSRWLS